MIIVCSSFSGFTFAKNYEKICMLFGFSSSGIFARSPSTLSGIWKTPLGPAMPSGIFKSPLGFGGSGRRSPRKNRNNLYKFHKNLNWNFPKFHLKFLKLFAILKFLVCIFFPMKIKSARQSSTSQIETMWNFVKLCEALWNFKLKFQWNLLLFEKPWNFRSLIGGGWIWLELYRKLAF